MALIEGKGKIDKKTLRNMLVAIHRLLNRVRVQSSKVSIKIPLIDFKAKVTDVVKQYDRSMEVIGIQPSPLANSIMIDYDPVPFRMEYIAGAWDELVTRSWSHWTNYNNVNCLNSVMIFRNQVSVEMQDRMSQADLFKKHKVVPTVFVEVVPMDSNPLAGQEITLKIQINLTQV